MSHPLAAPAVHHGLAADFAEEVLAELYEYPRKKKHVAWLLWAVLGIFGGHRYYLGRPGTGLLMTFTGGGALVWWIVDWWYVPKFLAAYNAEQARREGAGEPPVELAFMPSRSPDVLSRPPEWTLTWHERSRARNVLRFLGDVLVLIIAGSVTGALWDEPGGREAAAAVISLIVVTMLGGYAGQLDRVPLLHALLRWSHRLRLFYYFNRPGSPPALMVRGITVIFLAPFRRRDRAEVRMYLQLGAAFTAIFLGLNVFEQVVLPFFFDGLGAISPFRLFGLWLQEGVMTFIATYAFAAPVGAVLTLYMLTRRTHVVPRVLGLLTLFFIAVGAGIL